MSRNRVFLAVAVLLGALALSSLYTVAQSEQALVVRLGAPVEVQRTPGLHVKLPLIDTLVTYDAVSYTHLTLPTNREV